MNTDDSRSEQNDTKIDEFVPTRERNFIEDVRADSRYRTVVEGICRFDLFRRLLARFYGSLDIGVELDRDTLSPGEELSFRVTLANASQFSLPLLLSSQTIWGWSIDGLAEGHDSRLYPDSPTVGWLPGNAEFEFERQFDGYVRDREPDAEWRPLSPGRHDLTVFVNLEDDVDRKIADSAEFVVDTSNGMDD